MRARAAAIGYRMLGSRAEAEDIAQDTMVRVHAAMEREDLRTPGAFATTVATRLSIDRLRSARVRREQYVGPWLPEPVGAIDADDPAAAAELDDAVSFALLVVLESLGPVERAAFLLHDSFGYGYDELARILDRSPTACRQLVSRARRRVQAARPRVGADEHQHREVLERFLAAARGGDIDDLLAVLGPEPVFVSDGGASRKAARHPIRGRHRVSRFLRTIGPRLLEGADVELTTVNGGHGFVVWDGDEAALVGTIEVDDGRVRTIHWVRNPDKLTSFRRRRR